MFDYKGVDARALVAEAYDLAVYYSNGAPAGWRALSAAELGVAASHVDSGGFFRGQHLAGSQAHILGKFDDAGRLARLSVAFTATNDPGDYGAMNNDSYANDFDYLLDAVRTFAAPIGLAGRDVIVTGYSLGAGAANTMAAQRDYSWGGFYAQSDYIGIAVPKVTEVPNVLNFGFENDVVHRVIGEGDHDARAADPTLGVKHNDGPYGTATDNVVLFNDVYAVGGFEAIPITLADIPRGWAAHIDIPEENFVRRIGASTFYDRIEQDSAVVIAFLNDALRASVWVEDKRTVTSNHFGQSAFILGGAQADRLGDGAAGDFIDGFGGDDLIRLGGGDDRVNGGEGTDTVQLTGALTGYERVRLNDGTLYLRDRVGAAGTEILTSVERLTTRDPLDRVVYEVTPQGLTAAGRQTLTWAAHQQGGAGSDALNARAGGDRLFGLDGDDRLTGGAAPDWLDGGAGVDAAVFGGLTRAYTVAPGVSAVTGGGATDSLTAIERLQFADGLLSFDADSAAARIYRLYDTVFDRAPDSLGFNGWVRELQAGVTLEQVAGAFIGSGEFTAAKGALSSAGFVDYLYTAALNRTADAGGRAHWINQLDSGAMTRAQVAVGFAESAEHAAITAGAVGAGLFTYDPDYAFLAYLYDAAFDRAPDLGGLQWWAGAMKSGMNLAAISDVFAGSAEFRADTAGLDGAGVVDYLYGTTLNRDPTAAELSTWSTLLGAGLTYGQLLAQLALNGEHQILMQPAVDHGLIYS